MLLEGRDEDEEKTIIDDGTDETYPGDVDEEMLEKRIGANSEGWYDTPITENVVGGAELHPTAGGKRATLRSSVIGSELPIAIPYPEDSEESDDDDKAERVNHDNLLNDIDETEVLSAQEEKNELLHQILSGLSPNNSNNSLPGRRSNKFKDTGLCPAVMELSTNCGFTEKEGILINYEARSLCNRHKVCYKCCGKNRVYFSMLAEVFLLLLSGRNIGLTQERCDKGYRNTVIENFEGDVRCLRSAMLYLELMQQYRSYSPYGLSQWYQQPCVERFIYEGD